jgi:hypothetical protein
VAGYSLLDQKRSTDIRSQLKIFNLTVRIGPQEENWYEHILRMTTDRIRKILPNIKCRGHLTIRRPVARWEDIHEYFLDVGNRPMAYIPEEEQEE